MNIFYVDKDPEKAAQHLCDQHVIKMIIESAQLLSNAHHYYRSYYEDDVYRRTHANHPCTIWVCANSANYNWLLKHLKALLREYTQRYCKKHKTSEKLDALEINPIMDVPYFSDPPQVMPPKYYNPDDTVEAYRSYYIGEKMEFAKWKDGNKPEWITE